MKLASGFCIPEPLPVDTGIKGRQVHPLIRFLLRNRVDEKMLISTKPFIFVLFPVGVTVQSAESLSSAIPLDTSTERANSKRANHGRCDRCLQCLGRRHAEAAFVDDSCVCCGRMSMISLRSRLSFMKGLAPSAATRADLSGSSRGSPADALGDLRVTVRASPPGTPPRTSYSSRSEHPVRFPGDFAGLSHGAPSISFGAPSVDRMSVAASGDGFTSSEDEGAVGLPPSGVVATAAPDPELTAMLARAAVGIGLQVNRPPSPEPSRLNDWFLGAGRGSQPRPAPVPFFPEVHEELTSSWMAPFTARSRSSSSSVLTTLDGGVARGYAFPRWRERSRYTCAHETPPLGGTVCVSRPRPVNWQPLSRPKLTVLRARQPPPCTPWLSCRFTNPRRSNRCTRVVPTRGWCRSCARRLTSLYERRKSRRGPSGRRCPPWWSRSAISASTWQRWRTSTRHAFSTPPSPREGCSATPSRASPSSSRRYSSRPRRSSISCPGVMHHPPLPLGPGLSLPVAVGTLLRPPELLHPRPNRHIGRCVEPLAGEWRPPRPSQAPSRPGSRRSGPDAGNPEMLEFALSQETARTAPLLPPVEGREDNLLFRFVSVPPLVQGRFKPFSRRRWQSGTHLSCARRLLSSWQRMQSSRSLQPRWGRGFTALTSSYPRKVVAFGQSWICESWTGLCTSFRSRCWRTGAWSNAFSPRIGLQWSTWRTLTFTFRSFRDTDRFYGLHSKVGHGSTGSSPSGSPCLPVCSRRL